MASVHTHPANSTANPDIFKSAFQSGRKNKSSTNPITCGRVNPDIFEPNDVANSCPVSYRTINQYGGTTATTGHICRHYRALYGALSDHILLQRSPGYLSDPDTIRCVRAGEFNLNTLRLDGQIFESGKKKLRIEKYLDTCGRA